jgi:UDP:flavonoid glycosyltransferase YjiC (YdhE family)
MRIVFVAPPYAGHLYPQVPLAEAARAAGHTVAFVTGERKRAVLARRGLETLPLTSVPDGALEAIANPPHKVGSNPRLLMQQLRANLGLLPGIRNDLRGLFAGWRPDVVVADFVAPVGGFVAQEMGLPWVTTMPSPLVLETKRGTPSYCGGWTPGWGLRDWLGRLAVRGFKRGVKAWLAAEFRAAGVEQLWRPDGTEVVYSPEAILGLGIRELEFDRDWPASFEMIGPLVEDPEEWPAVTYPAGKKVLLTLGTHLFWAKERLRVPEAPGVSIVVAGSKEYPFVPYARDLGQFDAVIHHGGAGIAYAAILEGKPSLVWPQDYDHFDFAARVEWFGAGARRGTVEELLGREWPRLPELQKAARAYRPREAFLTRVAAMVR